jgi:plastocyanin
VARVTRLLPKRPLAWFAAAYAVIVVLALPTMILAEEPQKDLPSDDSGPASTAAAEQPAPGGDAAPSALEPGQSAPPAGSGAPPAAAGEATPPPAAAPASGGSADDAPRANDKPVAFAASPGSVTIKDFSFNPGTVTVSVGESVTWQNSGPSGHSATARDGSFDTGVLQKGKSASHTFNKAGTFAYICTPHPFMHGTVKVVAASNGGGGSGSTSNGAGGTGGTASSSSSGSSGSNGSSGSSGSAGSAGSGGETLASTGSEVWILAGLGVLLLGLGIAVERRTSH